jgi:hypothetical protein
MDNEEYVENILVPKVWGGEVEMKILSKYYQTEIAVMDIG